MQLDGCRTESLATLVPRTDPTEILVVDPRVMTTTVRPWAPERASSAR